MKVLSPTHSTKSPVAVPTAKRDIEMVPSVCDRPVCVVGSCLIGGKVGPTGLAWIKPEAPELAARQKVAPSYLWPSTYFRKLAVVIGAFLASSSMTMVPLSVVKATRG